MKKRAFGLFLAVVMVLTMSIPVFAADFTPSVEAKQAPEIAAQKDSQGNDCAAIIYDADGNEIAGVPFGNLIITPISSCENSSAEIRERLKAAYQQLKSADRLTDLSADLEKIVKEMFPNLTEDDLVIRDLFDVSVTGIYADYLKQEGNYIKIRFKLSEDAKLLAAVLHNIIGSDWETVVNDRITRNDDKTVDVVFYDLSPIALLFDAGKLGVDPNGPTSPQTGEPEPNNSVWVFAAAAVVLAAGCAVVVKRRFALKK